jgi:hypothetical protein
VFSPEPSGFPAALHPDLHQDGFAAIRPSSSTCLAVQIPFHQVDYSVWPAITASFPLAFLPPSIPGYKGMFSPMAESSKRNICHLPCG